MPAAVITAIIPQLPSTCLENTSRFYRQKLGFREVGRYPDWLVLQWEKQELQFWLTTDASLAETSSCYVRVQGIEALYKTYAAIPDLLRAEHALAVRAWGMNEFYVLDPDGNLLKFGEPVPWEPEAGKLPAMPALV
jgi:catechol 2,3-dioxygenase-like lactoylglutathione lyase family enzyme